jgi:hypothetical protein
MVLLNNGMNKGKITDWPLRNGALPGTRSISHAGFVLFLVGVVEQTQKQMLPIRRTHTGTNLM